MKQWRRTFWIVLISLVVVAIALSAFTPFSMNCWLVATGRGFEIPDGSSLFRFRVTKMNTGSGEWWLYGEDRDFFYVASEFEGVRYHAFPRARTEDCPGFERLDFTTWCPAITISNPNETRSEQTTEAIRQVKFR